jgi:hypothetical protein
MSENSGKTQESGKQLTKIVTKGFFNENFRLGGTKI